MGKSQSGGQSDVKVKPEKPIRITRVLNGGRQIELEDGTEWEVFFLNAFRSIDWEGGVTEVIVRKGKGFPFPYVDTLEDLEEPHFRRQVNAMRLN